MRRLALLLLVPLAAGTSACGRDEPEPRATERPELAVFRVEGNPPERAIVRLPVGGDREREVVTEPQPALFGRASWSPDGERLAFAADLDEDGRGFRRDVYVVNADGSGTRRLTSTGDADAPVWSPDGELIAFSRTRWTPPFRASLWVVAPDGAGLRELLPAANGRLDYPGSWSPDGESLVFTRATSGPGGDPSFDRTAVHVVGSDGSRVRRLAERGSSPVFSPDGSTIAFASDRDENGELAYGDQVSFANELYLMDADGGNARRLTETTDLNETPGDWSPDGEWIVYERGEVIDNAQGTGVFAYRLDDGCTRRLAYDPTLDSWYAAPAWRPESGSGLTC